MPALTPRALSIFSLVKLFGLVLNIAIAINSKKSIPNQCNTSSADVFSLSESTSNPTDNSTHKKPIAIPKIRETFAFFPKRPLWAKQVNPFGPGIIKAIPTMVNNSTSATPSTTVPT